MSIVPDRCLCTGCGSSSEPPCVRICPGDLLYKKDGKVAVRDAADCWDCAACVKVCPQGALYLQLPPVAGGRGTKLTARTYRDKTLWLVKRTNGREEKYSIPAVGFKSC